MPFRELKAYLWNWARSLAELDPRSLACLRIGLGAVLLYDIGLAWEVIDLWPGIQAYFDGLPLPAWAQPAGDVATLKVLFGVYALLALGLLLGYRTRFCALGALLVTGVHRAVAQTVDFHDDVIFHALLWMQMIDAGRCFSLDAHGGRRAAWRDRWSRVGACGLVFNVAYIYLSTVYEKGDPAWWPDGRAVYYALSDVALSGPLGRWMVAHLPLAALQFLSYQALAMELAGGLLLLSPWPRARQVGLSLLMLLQMGLWVCMRLESFPGIMLTVQMALVPGWVWSRLGMGARAPARASAPRPRWQRRLLAGALVAIVVVNIEGRRIGHIIDDEEPLPYPGAVEVHRLRQVFNLQYRWTMYAPSPPAYNGWWVCVGRTRSGAEIDPITGAVPTFAPPDNAAWPFGGLGSIYWFWEPDPEGYVQEEFADFILWQDARYTAKAERLTHFSLFYVYVPYEPVEDGPHAPMPMLALRWPEQEQGVMRPLLREDSALRGVGLYELDAEEWDWGERPGRASGVETY